MIKLNVFNQEVEIKNQMVSLENTIQICEKKINKAIEQAKALNPKVEVGVGVYISTDDKSFAGFNIHPTTLYEDAEWLDSISNGYTWFSENRDLYIIDINLFETLEMDTVELATKIVNMYGAYQNSVYVNCHKDTWEVLGVYNDIYKIDEETEHVFVTIEGIILEHNQDMQCIRTYIEYEDALVDPTDTPTIYKYESKNTWVEVANND